jgi:hypothetical protein
MPKQHKCILHKVTFFLYQYFIFLLHQTVYKIISVAFHLCQFLSKFSLVLHFSHLHFYFIFSFSHFLITYCIILRSLLQISVICLPQSTSLNIMFCFVLCLFFHIFVFIFVFTLIVLSLIHTYLSFLPFSSCLLVQIYHFHFHLHLIFILQPCFNFIYFSSQFNSYYILPFLPPRFLYSFQLSSLGNPITNYVFKFSEFSFL